MVSPKRPEEELREGSYHLYYEISIFFETARWYSEIKKAAQGTVNVSIPLTVLQNAFLESFLIHARLLLEFFHKECFRPDDIKPSDFLSDEGDSKKIIKPDKLLMKEKDHMDKKLAHLTYTRSREYAWNLSAILKGIVDCLNSYIPLMRQDILDPIWNKPPIFQVDCGGG